MAAAVSSPGVHWEAVKRKLFYPEETAEYRWSFWLSQSPETGDSFYTLNEKHIILEKDQIINTTWFL